MRHTRMAACEAAYTAHADQRARHAARPCTRRALLERTVPAHAYTRLEYRLLLRVASLLFPIKQRTSVRTHAYSTHAEHMHTRTTREARAAQSRASQGRGHDNDKRRQRRGRIAEGTATTSGNENRREGTATTSGVSAPKARQRRAASAGRQRQATSGRARSPPGHSTMCRARAATMKSRSEQVPVAPRGKAPLSRRTGRSASPDTLYA
jgi:hypothetical protein